MTQMSLERLAAISRHIMSEKSYCEKSPITAHVLDTSKGKPVSNLEIRLYQKIDHNWTLIDTSKTDENGRCENLRINKPVHAGDYMLYFKTKQYYSDKRESSFYPYIEIIFEITSPSENHHIPLLMSPFGYTTYRGS